MRALEFRGLGGFWGLLRISWNDIMELATPLLWQASMGFLHVYRFRVWGIIRHWGSREGCEFRVYLNPKEPTFRGLLIVNSLCKPLTHEVIWA